MNEESSGYRGEAQRAIGRVEASIGDRLRIARNGQVFEGTLMPRSEYGDEEHVVIKLKSGYNIGIRVTPNTVIERIGEGVKPAFSSPPSPEQNPKLPKIAILSTGGTIASRVDYRTGAVRPALTASDLYSVVPELSNIARIDTRVLFSLFSENVTPLHWTQMAKAVDERIALGAEGVVIAHGTDTMGYTAAALSFALQNLPVPVILVGSQRSADRPSSDSATNLTAAVIAAATAPFAEVVVAMHETTSDAPIALHRGTKVRKCHTSRRDAFKSVNSSLIARVQDQKVTMLADDYRRRDPSARLVLKPDFSEKVALLKFYPGMSPLAISSHVGDGNKALVFEGTGLGHVSRQCLDVIKTATKQGILVAMASQCVSGRVNLNVYETGRDLLASGVVPVDDMLAETALVKLMWIFGHTQDLEQAKKLLQTNIVGELSPRTLPEKTGDEKGGRLF